MITVPVMCERRRHYISVTDTAKVIIHNHSKEEVSSEKMMAAMGGQPCNCVLQTSLFYRSSSEAGRKELNAIYTSATTRIVKGSERVKASYPQDNTLRYLSSLIRNNSRAWRIYLRILKEENRKPLEAPKSLDKFLFNRNKSITRTQVFLDLMKAEFARRNISIITAKNHLKQLPTFYITTKLVCSLKTLIATNYPTIIPSYRYGYGPNIAMPGGYHCVSVRPPDRLVKELRYCIVGGSSYNLLLEKLTDKRSISKKRQDLLNNINLIGAQAEVVMIAACLNQLGSINVDKLEHEKIKEVTDLNSKLEGSGICSYNTESESIMASFDVRGMTKVEAAFLLAKAKDFMLAVKAVSKVRPNVNSG